MVYFSVLIITIIAGFIQSVTGFGSGIVMMLFFPSFFPLSIAPSVSEVVGLPLSIGITHHYKKAINYRLLLIPTIFFLAGTTLAIYFVTNTDLSYLKLLFGIFLFCLGIYNILFQSRIHIKGSLFSSFICAFGSGVFGGLFGIGGPLMVIYYLATTHTKEEYLGTLNALFIFTGIYRILLRYLNGLIPISIFLPIGIGIAGILIGEVVGNRFVDRVNGDQLKKLIYGFLCIAGLITIINCLI